MTSFDDEVDREVEKVRVKVMAEFQVYLDQQIGTGPANFIGISELIERGVL